MTEPFANDPVNRRIHCAQIKWTHNGVEYQEELKDADRIRFCLIDRITVADWMLNDADPLDTTVIYFAGHRHNITEQDLHALKLAVHKSMIGMAECLPAPKLVEA